MAGRLDKKLVWITGGSRGIGAAIARGCVAEGARVVVSSRKQEGLDAFAATFDDDAKGSVVTRVCHMGKPEDIATTVEWIVAEVGIPDVLFNNAATNPYFGPLLRAPASMWDKTFEVNVRGCFEATRRVVDRWLAADRGGSVVNVASIQGSLGAPLQGVYGMTKAAVISMTRTLAVELGRSNIRVNAIAPGLVDTRFAAAMTGSADISKMYTDRTALGRYAEPDEISGLAVYLACDDATYVTGQVFTIDGGYTAT